MVDAMPFKRSTEVEALKRRMSRVCGPYASTIASLAVGKGLVHYIASLRNASLDTGC